MWQLRPIYLCLNHVSIEVIWKHATRGFVYYLTPVGGQVHFKFPLLTRFEFIIKELSLLPPSPLSLSN